MELQTPLKNETPKILNSPSHSNSTISTNNSTNKKEISIKKKIMCKYFMMGRCTKGENCFYLHSITEMKKRINIKEKECPMYEIGYCKNGSLCKYKHIFKEKNENFQNENLNDENDEKKEFEDINFPEIPIWYIEHYFDKPIYEIFIELEQNKNPEIIKIQKEIGFDLNQLKSLLNPINFLQNNNLNSIDNSNIKNNNNHDYTFVKNNIEKLLNNSNNEIKYYLVRIQDYKGINISMEKNILKIGGDLKEKILENKNLIIITIISDEENKNFSGFARIKNINDENINNDNNESDIYNIKWLWRTKLHFSKLNHLINKKDNYNRLVNCANGCCIDNDLGKFICRLMMKRLSKDEINQFKKEKQIFEEENKKFNYDNNNNSNYKRKGRKNNICNNNNIQNKNYSNNYNYHKYNGHKRMRSLSHSM
jgi:hypothetical protein